MCFACLFFFSSRRRHTRSLCDWSSDVCSSDLGADNRELVLGARNAEERRTRGPRRDLCPRLEPADRETLLEHREAQRRVGRAFYPWVNHARLLDVAGWAGTRAADVGD